MTNTTKPKMQCEICKEEIRIGEVVHEVPNYYCEMIIMCHRCYNI